MKRMIPQSLITWVKSLFHRVSPGAGEGDIEIGGNLEVDGYFFPSIKLASYQTATYGVKMDNAFSGSGNILRFKGDIYDDDVVRSAYILSGSNYAKVWASPDSNGYYCNAQLLAYSVSASNMWAGVGVIHNDASGSSYSALDIGFAHQYTGYRTYNNYLILNDRLEVKKTGNYIYNISEPTNLKTASELTTSEGGTATLVSTRLEKEELYIGGHTTIHASLTESLGNSTSGQVTFTGTNLNANQSFTGVLLKAGVLVGVCCLKINSATEAVLYYQNPLGLSLDAGEYAANLNLIASN